MWITPEHEPHEGDDYIVYNPETVCQARTYTGSLCSNESAVTIGGKRYCVFHADLV